MKAKTSPVACVLLAFAIAAPLVCGQSAASRGTRSTKVAATNGAASSDWPMYGRDLAGSHYNPNEKQITPATVARLKPKWIFQTGADVSSQPTVVNGVVYFGSWDG